MVETKVKKKKKQLSFFLYMMGHFGMKITSIFLTLSISKLLSESVCGDDQHPLDPPEQHDIIAL